MSWQQWVLFGLVGTVMAVIASAPDDEEDPNKAPLGRAVCVIIGVGCLAFVAAAL